MNPISKLDQILETIHDETMDLVYLRHHQYISPEPEEKSKHDPNFDIGNKKSNGNSKLSVYERDSKFNNGLPR